MAQTGWTLTGIDRRGEFEGVVRPLLERDPVRNTVILGNLARLGAPGREPRAEDCCGWWADDAGDVRAALLRMGTFAVVLSADVPERAADELPGAWHGAGRGRPSGVFGQVLTAERAAAGWAESTGGTYRERPKHAMRLFSFDEPTPPDPAPRGSARLAALDDAELIAKWDVAFLEECGIPHDGEDRAPAIRARITEGDGQILLWTVDGEPVAQAMHTPLAAGVARIVGVYTPPEHRRNGYAAGLTWALTHLALDKGAASVVLHTDLSNPTSNAVYQRLGYRAVQDVTEFELAD